MNDPQYRIHSMTAFAREEISAAWGSLSLEMRSLNQRYLEIHPRLPEDFRPLEPAIRKRLQQALGRGKVEVFLRFHPAHESGDAPLVLNETLARSLADSLPALQALAAELQPASVGDLLRFPGLLRPEAPAMEAVYQAAETLLDTVLQGLLQARAQEGRDIAGMIAERLAQMRTIHQQLCQWLPEVRQQLRTRMEQRLAEMQLELDPGRVEQEFVLQAMKLDVDEELDRLRMHIQAMESLLGQAGPVGRKMDFLAQEMNREANTLGSKSTDARLSNAAVELKVLIEQIREQVQNIE